MLSHSLLESGDGVGVQSVSLTSFLSRRLSG